MFYMVMKLIEISNPNDGKGMENDGKGMEKFVKCYSDLTGKNSYILTCYLQPIPVERQTETFVTFVVGVAK